MLLALLFIVLSFIGLIWAADRFVIGAAAVARRFDIPPLVIGMTIVALGTSAPEIFVATIAAINHQPGLALGSAIGSNIANIGLVLGCTALLFPINVKPSVLWREYPLVLLCTVILCLMFNDRFFSRLDGFILLLLFFAYLCYSIWRAQHQRRLSTTEADTAANSELRGTSLPKAIALILIGIILLPISAEVLVNHVSQIAHYFHISNEVIGLTVVAIGTSLPELAASLSSARKGFSDIALGNVMGSNVFNIIAVLPSVGLISPTAINPMILYRDVPCLLFYTLLVFIFGFTPKDKHRFSRWEGGLLLFSYFAYMVLVYQTR